MSLLDTASLVITPNGTNASKLYSVVPSDGSGDMTVTRATTATRVNSAGLIESVASNVPRLDYSNGTCPSILVEPQRTNLFTYSEQFDNATWTKDNASITVNSIISPDGNITADKLIENTINNSHGIIKSVTNTSGQLYTVTFFVKASERNWILIYVGGGPGQGRFFNVANGTIGDVLANTPNASSIEDYGNGWYRCSITYTATDSSSEIYLSTAISNGVSDYTGDGTSGVYIWGAQSEAGSYATSYIPTTSASVTRNADVISKTGISSLIGQTEGVLFLDYQPLNVVDAYPIDFQLQYNGDNSVNGVTIYHAGNTPAITVRSGGSIIFSATLTATTVGTRNKIAIAYKNNSFAVYQNGVLKASQSTGIVPAILNEIRINDGNRNYSINSASVWKTRLSNTQLAQLTTI